MYKTTCDALRNLPPDQFKASLVAIWDYGMEDKEPEGDPVVAAMVGMVKPLIDKNNRNYENGKKGGRHETDYKPTTNRPATEREPIVTDQEPNRNPNVKGEMLKEKEEKNLLADEPPRYPYRAVVEHLNEKAGTRYKYTSKDTRAHIRARLDQGFSLEDFHTVIDKKTEEWRGTEFEKFLRPSTLFGPKFESYLNQQIEKKKPSNRFNNFEGRSYDFDALERQLLEAQEDLE